MTDEGEGKMKIYISATLRNFFGKNPVIEISENNIKADG